MKFIKSLFSTTKKAILTSACALLILIGVGVGTSLAADNIAESTAIGYKNAEKFAFVDAKVDPASAQLIKTEFDFEQGQFVYEIEFVSDGVEYEYWINASNGAVVKKKVEIISFDDKVNTPIEITIDEAKEIALSDADVSSTQVKFTKTSLDYDDNGATYDIEFHTSSHEYEYEIDINNGAIIERNIEAFPIKPSGTETKPESKPEVKPESKPEVQPAPAPEVSQSSSSISVDQAKDIAVNHAGLSSSQVTFIKAKMDNDDGMTIYEIEFYYNGIEYEYDINASNGSILEFDSDVDD